MTGEHDASGTIACELSDAQALVGWVIERLHEIEIQGDHRTRVAGQLFDLVIEHHAGIVQLLTSRIYASAFALVRCEFECLVRGAWIYHCASNQEIERFIEKDKIEPKVAELIKAIEEKPEFKVGVFSTVKNAAWEAMNGYTHGGIHQISRRQKGSYIEPNFGSDEILEVIRISGVLALIALGQIALIAGLNELWGEVDARLNAPLPGLSSPETKS